MPGFVKLPLELLYNRMRQLRNSSPKEFPLSSQLGRKGFSLPRSCPRSWTAQGMDYDVALALLHDESD